MNGVSWAGKMGMGRGRGRRACQFVWVQCHSPRYTFFFRYIFFLPQQLLLRIEEVLSGRWPLLIDWLLDFSSYRTLPLPQLAPTSSGTIIFPSFLLLWIILSLLKKHGKSSCTALATRCACSISLWCNWCRGKSWLVEYWWLLDIWT